MKHQNWHRIAGAAAVAAVAMLSTTALAADPPAQAKSQAKGYYSESIAVSSPHGRITGSTSGPATGQASDKDQQILDKVMTALTNDSQLSGADIRVQVEGGKVSLEGTAKDSAEAKHAEQIAQNAAGEAPVANHLTTGG